MFRSLFTKLVCPIALAMVCAFAGHATADVVASYAGPHTFTPPEAIVLNDVSTIGLHGTLSMDFIAPNITTRQFLWSATDAFGGSPPGEGEMALQLRNGRIGLSYWTQPTQVLNAGHSYESLPVPNDGLVHHVDVTWSDGFPVVLRLDGVGIAAKQGGSGDHPPTPYTTWTTTPSAHLLGGERNSSGTISFPFSGTISNMYLQDIYTHVLGDVTFDGIVNGQDIALVASHWLEVASAPGLIKGDENMDGIVNGQEVAIIASHWLNTSPPLPGGGGSAVPEPGTMTLLIFGAVCGAYGLLRRRTIAQ